MEITAQLNNLRIAPRKVRAITGLLKGMNAVQAKNQLNYLARRSAKPISKLLDSAMANAYNNFRLVKENLFVKDIIVNEGRKLKRGRPKGFGMISPIEKKTSRVKIILDERVPGMKAEKKPKEIKPEIAQEQIRTPEKGKRAMAAKPREAREIKKKGVFGGIKGLSKRFFRRKAI